MWFWKSGGRRRQLNEILKNGHIVSGKVTVQTITWCPTVVSNRCLVEAWNGDTTASSLRQPTVRGHSELEAVSFVRQSLTDFASAALLLFFRSTAGSETSLSAPPPPFALEEMWTVICILSTTSNCVDLCRVSSLLVILLQDEESFGSSNSKEVLMSQLVCLVDAIWSSWLNYLLMRTHFAWLIQMQDNSKRMWVCSYSSSASQAALLSLWLMHD